MPVLDRAGAVGFVPAGRRSQVSLVTCSYTTSGGVPAPRGAEPEAGRLYGVIADGQATRLIRVGDAHADLGFRFADWDARNHPSRSPSTLGRAESGRISDPGYTAAGALEHRALAGAMATALAKKRHPLW